MGGPWAWPVRAVGLYKLRARQAAPDLGASGGVARVLSRLTPLRAKLRRAEGRREGRQGEGEGSVGWRQPTSQRAGLPSAFGGSRGGEAGRRGGRVERRGASASFGRAPSAALQSLCFAPGRLRGSLDLWPRLRRLCSAAEGTRTLEQWRAGSVRLWLCSWMEVKCPRPWCLGP